MVGFLRPGHIRCIPIFNEGVPNIKRCQIWNTVHVLLCWIVWPLWMFFVDPALFRRSHRFSRLPLGVRWKWLKTWTFHSWVPFHLIPELVCCTFMHIPTSNVQLLYQYSNAVSKGYVVVRPYFLGLYKVQCHVVLYKLCWNFRRDNISRIDSKNPKTFSFLFL